MKKVLIFCIGILLAHGAKAQGVTTFFGSLSLQKEEKPHYNLDASHYTPIAASYWFYKTLVSSQDGSHCPFEISCSLYAVQSVNKLGLAAGLLNGLDRLQRCNGFSNSQYPRNPRTGKLIDPVR